MTTFEDFIYALPNEVRVKAGLDADLADVYWRARRGGYTHDQLVGLVTGIGWARNPIAVALKVMRDAINTPPKPPRGKAAAAGHLNPHRPCPDHHDGCVLCGCYGDVVHHVATPMPDWFKQQWRDVLKSTQVPP